MRQFIELYRSYPCLWKIKSADYSNKFKKSAAIEALIELCRKTYPSADQKFVKSKIQNIRTVYKKELNKIESSKRSGAGADEIYVPRLWYFDLLSFTRDQETPRTSNSNAGEDYGDLLAEQSQNDSNTESSPHTDNLEENEAQTSHEETALVSVENRVEHPITNTQRKRKNPQQIAKNTATKLIATANSLLDKKTDEFDAVGINVAAKMRRMNPGQQLFFEKMLTDLLIKGVQGELDDDTILCSRRQHQYNPPNTEFRYPPGDYHSTPNQNRYYQPSTQSNVNDITYTNLF
ncbi:uncharacterized protein [Dendropsophus ebraccatus]|uniref:uncharacterized protein n=1 Tax=Dendropsophus ebraccatus TaxID=150705 RepID=UPI0038315441